MRLKSKKTKQRKLFWLAPLGIAGLGVGVLAALNPGMDAQTTPDSTDARLRTRRYHASLDEVQSALETLIPQMKTYGASWRLVQAQNFDAGKNSASGLLKVEVPVTVFVDEMTITLRAAGSATLVDARSSAVVRGKSDFGENRRHVIQLLSALDEKLSQI